MSIELKRRIAAVIDADAPEGELGDRLIDCAGALQDVSDRDFELAATKVATEVPSSLQAQLLDVSKSIAKDRLRSNDVRTWALVVAAIICRRSGFRTLGQSLFRDVPPFPERSGILLLMRALSYLHGDIDELRVGRELAEEAYILCPENPGVMHALADFQLEMARFPEERSSRLDLVDKGIRLVGKALVIEQRPRFYYTRARLERIRQQFDQAEIDLNAAMEREDRNSVDHAQRVFEYRLERALLDADRDMREAVHVAIQRVDWSIDEVRREQARTVEIVVFVAAILALIQFTAISVNKDWRLWQAIVLVGCLGVILILAVLAGVWMLHLSSGRRRTPLETLERCAPKRRREVDGRSATQSPNNDG